MQAASEIKCRSRPAEVGRMVGETEQTMSNWKTRGVPRAKHVTLAGILGCTPEWLATGRGPMRPSGLPPPPAEPPTVQELLSRLKTGTDTLPPTVRKAAADMITGYLISSDGDAEATLQAIGTLLKLPKP